MKLSEVWRLQLRFRTALTRCHLPLSCIICEATSPWASALRVAIARQQNSNSLHAPPRILETRSLPELIAALSENAPQLALVEVRPDNLAPILQLFAERRQPLSCRTAPNLCDQRGEQHWRSGRTAKSSPMPLPRPVHSRSSSRHATSAPC